ncbi:Dcp2, box A domain-containing protein [Collybia nuda]|uniref:Dcp2, box A domain-containing protein n=1 Tax=Collybia nuda TaxID=64659 RepID=A0A9P5XY44_9AGAR|nr:Dcp2, box A domain-containing protein [Collybia nuda]
MIDTGVVVFPIGSLFVSILVTHTSDPSSYGHRNPYKWHIALHSFSLYRNMTSSSSSSPEVSAATGPNSPDRFSYKHATHDEVLEDLSSRFILNLPDEELASLERICFQVEQAHWFYEDFIREENPKFPSLPLKKFSAMLFHACPLLHHWSHDHEQAFNTFMQYKTRVPVCGAIMLNDTWEKCVLVKGWKSSSGWGFPKGKINEDEPPANCAVREVLEETGYNLAGQIDPQNVIEMSIKEQKISLFIVPGVPEDYEFKTKTRKEISKIEWFRLTDLPTWRRNKTAPGRFYLISPFIGALKAFINDRKPRASSRKTLRPRKAPPGQTSSLSKNITSHDATHESSSQSSSAENGEPHTPSPHYTEPLANQPSYIVDNETSKVEAPDTGMDPHFARLLSSLTMSASPLSHEITKKKPAIPSPTIANLPERRKQGTPAPTVRSPGTPSSSIHQVDWSSSVPNLTSPRINPPTLHLPISGYQFAPIHHNDQIHHLPSPRPFDDVKSSNLNSNVSSKTPSIPPLFTSTATAPNDLGPPRASSTGGSSPYLQSVENSSSTKVQRQLALLEAVADESARMSPFLIHTAPTNPRTMDQGIPLSHPPVSILSQPIMSFNENDFRTEGNALLIPVHSTSHSSSNTPLVRDHFQLRSKTSHTYHRNSLGGSSGTMSMNQGQLLSMMNGPRAAPPTPHLYPQQSRFQGIHAPPFPNSIPESHWPAQRTMYSLNAPPFVSHTGSSLAPVIHPFPKNSHSLGGSLLSILNNNRNGPGTPYKPSMSPHIFINRTPQS